MPRRARDRYIAARLRVRRRVSSASAGAMLAIRMGPNSLKAGPRHRDAPANPDDCRGPIDAGRTNAGLPRRVPVERRCMDMKVRNSLKSLKAKDGSYVVRRRGRVFVMNKRAPRLKARQG